MRLSTWPKTKPVHPFSKQGGVTNVTHSPRDPGSGRPHLPHCWGAALDGDPVPPSKSFPVDSHPSQLPSTLCCLVPGHRYRTHR